MQIKKSRVRNVLGTKRLDLHERVETYWFLLFATNFSNLLGYRFSKMCSYISWLIWHVRLNHLDNYFHINCGKNTPLFTNRNVKVMPCFTFSSFQACQYPCSTGEFTRAVNATTLSSKPATSTAIWPVDKIRRWISRWGSATCSCI